MTRVGATLPIIVAAFAAHGLALVNDGVFWDDWVYLTQLREGHAQLVVQAYVDLGVPAQLPLLLLSSAVPGVLAYRLLALVALIAMGLLAASLVRSLDLASAEGARVAGIFVVVSPIYGVLISPALLPYLGCIALLLGGFVLALRAERAAGRRAVTQRVASIALLALGLAYPLLLAAYAGLGLAVLAQGALRRDRDLRATLVAHADHALLPVVVALVDLVFLRQSGIHAGTYALQPAALWAGDLLAAAGRVTIDLALHTLISAGALPIVLIIVLVASVAIADAAVRIAAPSPRRVVTIALALVIVSLLPSAVTGRLPGTEGWASRQAFMAAVPLTLVPVALGTWVARLMPSRRAVAVAFLALLIASSTAASAADQLGWIARWAKDRSVIAQLAASPEARRASVIWVRDEYFLGSDHDYRFYERVGMLGEAFGDRSRIGLDVPLYTPSFLDDGRAYFGPAYLLEGFDPRGCQAELTVGRGTAMTPVELALGYLTARWSGPAALDSLLRSVATVRVRPLASPYATHCVTAGLPTN